MRTTSWAPRFFDRHPDRVVGARGDLARREACREAAEEGCFPGRGQPLDAHVRRCRAGEGYPERAVGAEGDAERVAIAEEGLNGVWRHQ